MIFVCNFTSKLNYSNGLKPPKPKVRGRVRFSFARLRGSISIKSTMIALNRSEEKSKALADSIGCKE